MGKQRNAHFDPSDLSVRNLLIRMTTGKKYTYSPITIRIVNNTEYKVTFDGYQGSDWSTQEVEIASEGDSGDAFVFRAPQSIFQRRWGWLNFTYHPVGLSPIQFMTYCYFENDNTVKTMGACVLPHQTYADSDPLPTRLVGTYSTTTSPLTLVYTFIAADLHSSLLSGRNFMSTFSSTYPAALKQPITSWILPGTHDSATYGPGVFPWSGFRWNWNCQPINIFDQLSAGARFLDLRFQLEGDGKWWPNHGLAVKTADRLELNGGSNEEATASILGQVLRFVNGSEGEIVILSLLAVGGKGLDGFWRPVLTALKDKAFAVPGSLATAVIPTCEVAMQQGKNVIIQGTYDPTLFQPSDPLFAVYRDYVWATNGTYNRFWGGSPWTGEDWQTTNPTKPTAYTEKWMETHKTDGKIWNAQNQLTPPNLPPPPPIPDGSPALLSKIMNPFVKQNLINKPLWLDRANVMTVDFLDEDIALSIAGMNFAKLD